MDFTEVYPLASGSKDLVSFSPGGHFILSVIQDRVIVRRSNTLQITRKWKLDTSPSGTESIVGSRGGPETQITHIGWSCDSEYLFAACSKQGTIHVFNLRDEAWNCCIDAGAEGLVKAEWAPDGRHILCFSQWGLRVTIWSLTSTTATYIQGPSHVEQGHDFSSDGRCLAISERHSSKQFVGIYDALDSYKLIRHFSVPLSSLSSISLSPNGVYLSLWEDRFEYKLVILGLTGTILATFSPPQDPGVGIKKVRWHPKSTHLAVYGFEDKIYILDSISWTCVMTLEPPSRLPSSVNVWREPHDWMNVTEGRGFLSYEKCRGIHTLSLNRVDPAKPLIKGSIVDLQWNISGTLLSVRYDSAPHVVCIYECPLGNQFSLILRSVLLHSDPVVQVRWNPTRQRNIAVATGQKSVYVWSDEWVNDAGLSEELAECIGIPSSHFIVDEVKWGGDGKSLVLVGKESFCCAFEVEEEA